jgi:hypothetical protein
LDTSSGYLLFNITDHAFVKSRDVRFNEDEFSFHGIDHSDPLFNYEPEDTSDGSYRETREVDQISGRKLQVEIGGMITFLIVLTTQLHPVVRLHPLVSQ